MKLHVTRQRGRIIHAYYDVHLRLWCAYAVQASTGYQSTDAQYAMTRNEAEHLAALASTSQWAD